MFFFVGIDSWSGALNPTRASNPSLQVAPHRRRGYRDPEFAHEGNRNYPKQSIKRKKRERKKKNKKPKVQSIYLGKKKRKLEVLVFVHRWNFGNFPAFRRIEGW